MGHAVGINQPRGGGREAYPDALALALVVRVLLHPVVVVQHEAVVARVVGDRKSYSVGIALKACTTSWDAEWLNFSSPAGSAIRGVSS